MVFFWEFAFFLAALVAVALAELVHREAAVAWGVMVTLTSIAARLTIGRRVEAAPPGAALRTASERTRWWRVTLDGWSHFNRALALGAAALLAWEAVARFG